MLISKWMTQRSEETGNDKEAKERTERGDEKRQKEREEREKF
jgi:hypothetical protein